jgi:hypothetical protein
MPKYSCTYAYDISCYFDFTVEAKDWEEAERKIEKALAEKAFDYVCADPRPACGPTPDSERVFVNDETDNDYDSTLEDLIDESSELKETSKT